MIAWITHNLATIAISIVLLLLAGLAAQYIYKTRKRGGCAGCGGSCKNCPRSCTGGHKEAKRL